MSKVISSLSKSDKMLDFKITNIQELDEILSFTISNINVSYINAIRRVILSSIPILVFKSEPYEKNNINIISNKTRLNNEIIKQRISCIPVHISDIKNFPYKDYVFEINVKNDTPDILYITTNDFKIKNVNSDTYLSESEVSKIFPPNNITGDYIIISRLRENIEDNIDCEELILNATLEIGTAEESGMFNVSSICCYGNTIDSVKIKEEWSIKEEELKKNHNKEEINFIKKDWMLIDAKKIFIENSFDFQLESIGIYDNFKLIELACNILINKLTKIISLLSENSDLIYVSNDTLDNCYIVKLLNEDYTIGKILEYYLYENYFKNNKTLQYVGFLKKHPHDNFSIIKLSFKEMTNNEAIIAMIQQAVDNSILLINSIKEYFTR